MAKLSVQNTYVMPLYCAMQDDEYVYLVRAPVMSPRMPSTHAVVRTDL